MSETFAQLQALTDDELIDQHDARAKHTQLGTAAYLDELNRREQHRLLQRSTEAAEAQATHVATIARLAEAQAAYLEQVADLIGKGADQNSEMVRLTRTMRTLAMVATAATLLSVAASLAALVVALAN